MIKDSVSVIFFLRSRSKTELPKIYMRIIVSREKTEISLGHSIKPEDWDEGRQRTKKNKAYNEEITYNENKVHEIKRELQFSNKPVTLKAIINRLKGLDQDNPTLLYYFTSFVDRLDKQPDYSRIMIQKYRNCINKLKDFLKTEKSKDILINQINYKWIQNFDHYLLSCINTAINKPLSRNTANKQHARLKTVLAECLKEGILKADPYTNVSFKSVKSSREYLNSQELELIQNHDLGNNLSLQKVRDVFIFSVYTGLRYVDAMGLKDQSISKDEQGNYWIEFVQIKTSEKVRIPLLKKAVEIYKKYEIERKITGNVLPRISNQKINVYLKAIGEITGIKKKLTHHVARHTCATTVLLDNNVPMEVVSKWLGHNSMKTTQIYGKITSKRLSDFGKRLDEEL